MPPEAEARHVRQQWSDLLLHLAQAEDLLALLAKDSDPITCGRLSNYLWRMQPISKYVQHGIAIMDGKKEVVQK